MSGGRWTVRLSAAAEADYREILRWTVTTFGAAQAKAYAETIASAFQALTAGPTTMGSKKRDDIGENLWTLHVARNGRKGRHFVLFRVAASQKQDVIDVLRLLHDSMDLQRHL